MIGSTIAHSFALVAAIGAERVIIALAVIVALTVMVIAKDLDGNVVIGIFSALIGYVVGAGHEAAKAGP